MKIAGHFAFNSTMTRLRALFYFPSMSSQVQQYLAHCEECLHKKSGVDDKSYQYANTERGYLSQSCLPWNTHRNLHRFGKTVYIFDV